MTHRLPSVLLTAAALAGSLAMAPALPLADPTEEESGGTQEVVVEDDGTTAPELYEPCEPVEGATTVTPDAGFDGTVPTPVGALNATPAEDAGLYQLDLAGLALDSVASVRMTLSWDTPELGDYDLVVNGTNDLSTASPETHSRTLRHCDLLDLETVVFTGLPIDTLTLQVAVTKVIAPVTPVAVQG